MGRFFIKTNGLMRTISNSILSLPIPSNIVIIRERQIERAKKFVKELMDEDMVFGVGTDAHGVQTRAPKMKKAADYVKKKYGEEYMRRIFFDNAATLLRKRK